MQEELSIELLPKYGPHLHDCALAEGGKGALLLILEIFGVIRSDKAVLQWRGEKEPRLRYGVGGGTIRQFQTGNE